MARSQYECCNCKSTALYARVVVVAAFPLAARNGSIKLAGGGINQVEIKLAWDKDESGGEKPIKRDIVCTDCLAVHEYVTAEDRLRLVDHRR
jgi:hypothetical protein